MNAPDDSSVRARRLAVAAAWWALIFGTFHMIWAAGWYPLLQDPEQAAIAFATPWKWWYDVGAGVACFIAIPVVLAPVSAWGRHLPRRLVRALMVTGTGVLVLRAVASIIQTIYQVVAGHFSWRAFGIWEPWFYLGAMLFALSTWYSRPVRSRMQTA